MRQRVALARALAQDSQLLLMDEPFAALDAITRDVLHDELTRIWRETDVSVLFVTHNVREAVRLAAARGAAVLPARPDRARVDGRHPAAAPDRGRRRGGTVRRDHRRTAWGDPPPWPALRRPTRRAHDGRRLDRPARPDAGRPRRSGGGPRRAGHRAATPYARSRADAARRKVAAAGRRGRRWCWWSGSSLFELQVADDLPSCPRPPRCGTRGPRTLAARARCSAIIWTSVSRGLLGFLLALAIGTRWACWSPG